MNQQSLENRLKIYVLAPGENWVVDRFVKEWNSFSGNPSCENPRDADIVWLLADWAWKNILSKISYEELKQKKVVTTVHHIVPEKFSAADRQDFVARDFITDVYHVYNERTADFISSLTKKPIKLIRYWANDSLWRRDLSRNEARKILGISDQDYLVGSFQRDTEGSDLLSPKLEKGPDIFCEYVESIFEKNKSVSVLLGGWRRQYIINRLTSSGVPFRYIERPSDETVNTMYQSLDLYVVSARCEGGPQSLIECGLAQVPCISTPVGIAEQVLESSSINESLLLASPGIPSIDHMKMIKSMPDYVTFFQSL
jgi:hypothetical protein